MVFDWARDEYAIALKNLARRVRATNAFITLVNGDVQEATEAGQLMKDTGTLVRKYEILNGSNDGAIDQMKSLQRARSYERILRQV